jgi:hypothetical protein
MHLAFLCCTKSAMEAMTRAKVTARAKDAARRSAVALEKAREVAASENMGSAYACQYFDEARVPWASREITWAPCAGCSHPKGKTTSRCESPSEYATALERATEGGEAGSLIAL